MKTIALKRLQLLSVTPGRGLGLQSKLILQAELAKLGYRICNPELLDHMSDAFFLDYRTHMATLAEMRGGDVEYVPLFLGFPNEVPNGDTYFAKRLMGYLGNSIEIFTGDPALNDGTVVPEWLFDLEQFGANPITQMQDKNLWSRAKARLQKRSADAHVEWIEVELVFADDVSMRLHEWLLACLYAKSSIKEAWHSDLATCLQFLGTEKVDPEKIVMKENAALLLRLVWQQGFYDNVVELAKTPTDVLRLFAALTGSDISLCKPVRFPKLSRVERKTVLRVLEFSSELAEDLKRYKGLWLALGRYLHPGEYKRAFPKTFAAFDALRNGQIETFASRTEALLAKGELQSLLAHLKKRPGVLARKLHEVLRRFEGQRSTVLSAFSEVSRSMTTKNLLILKSYFSVINDSEFRTIINKKGTIKVLDNNAHGALGVATLQKLDQVLDNALLAVVGAQESWRGKGVWIDPQLANYTVPLAQRAASDGILTLGRGSRIPVDCSKVLRLFVYWKQAAQRTDLDLSALQFDAGFNYAGHVSYTNLSEDGVLHSGDLQSAPHGAAEFIDVTVAALPENVRYLAVQVYRFSGEAFADMQCHAGWMVREKASGNYKSFDVKTVQHKFDLTGRSGYCVPLIVDLHSKEIIMTDLYMGNKSFHNSVEGAFSQVSQVSRELSRFTESRPTIKTLAEIHLQARGGTVADKADADILFSVEGGTYNATDVETLLSELL